MKDSNSIVIYIDESGHLSSNDSPMILGCIWGRKDNIFEFSRKIKHLKKEFGIPHRREIKWTKVSDGKLDYYKRIIDVFSESDGVNYRAVIIDKKYIDNETWQQSDDDFYYKMTYILVKNIVERNSRDFKIYLDYKDTISHKRCEELEYFLKIKGKFSSKTFACQPIKSYEVIALQMADLLNGAVRFCNMQHGDNSSVAKKKIVDEIIEKFSIDLRKSTAKEVKKNNLLYWKPKSELV